MSNCWAVDCWDGWGACSAPPRPASFRGGWWTLAVWPGGAMATRAPSFITDPSWVEFDDLGRQVLTVHHETDYAVIPDIVSGGVTLRCIGAAGSQYADGSWFAPARASVVWYQLHFAPLDDLATKTPRAALACIQVGDHTAGAQQSNPGNHQATLLGCWLVNDVDGDPEHWDSPEKLCHYMDNWDEHDGLARKTLVGPEHFAFQTRRMSSGSQDKIVYYAIDQATPTTVTYTNAERGTETDWKPIFFSSYAFPWCLWGRANDIEYYGSGTLKKLSRQYRLAKALLPSLAVDTSTVLANNGVFQDAAFFGQDDPEPEDLDLTITLSDTAVYFLDCELSGAYRPSVTTEGGTPITLHQNMGSPTVFPTGPYAGPNNPAPIFDPPDIEGVDYVVGCIAITVSRAGSSNFGFMLGDFSLYEKPPWMCFTPMSFAAGEFGISAFGSNLVDDSDGIIWRANNRDMYRIFARRHNGWDFSDSYWAVLVGQFYCTTKQGIYANPWGSTPFEREAVFDPGYNTIVQAAAENFGARPPFGGPFKANQPAVAITNWSPLLNGEWEDVWLGYVENDAWYWREGDVVSPLWRATDSGLVANRVATSGWYWRKVMVDDEPQYILGAGVIAYDGSIDDLTETMGDSIPPAP